MSDPRSELPPETPIELSVIVPCLNEELNIPELARARPRRRSRWAASRASCSSSTTARRDGTARVIRGARWPRTRACVVGVLPPAEPRHRRRRGAPAPPPRAASSSPIIDADLQYQPEDLLRLRRELYEHSVDVVQGWRSAVGREQGPALPPESRGFNTLLNAAFGMTLQDNKSGFVMCAREVLRGPAHLQGQLLLLAVVHHGGRPRQGLLVQGDRDALRAAPAGRRRFLDETAVKRRRRKSLVDLGKAALGVPRCGRSRPTSPRSSSAATRSSTARRARSARARRCAGARTWRRSTSTHWMITRDVEHYYETLRKTQWLVAGADARAAGREAAAARPPRLPQRALLPRAHAGARSSGPRTSAARPTCTSCRSSPRPTSGEHLYFDIMSENHDKSRGPQDHDQRLHRRALRLLRRPRAARVPLGGDAARAGVDGLPLRRPDACGSGTRRSA